MPLRHLLGRLLPHLRVQLHRQGADRWSVDRHLCEEGAVAPGRLAFGLLVCAFLAFIIAAIPQPSGEHYWWQIILPGSVVGLVVGYATQQ